MLKKILITVLFIALAVGCVYSWKKVDFNRKTAMFFQMAFGDENAMGGPGGPPRTGESQGGDMSRPGPPGGQEQERDNQGGSSGPPQMGGAGERGAPPDFGQGGQPGARPEGGGHGGPGGPGGYISLDKVVKYTVIMAFFVMLTRMLDQWILLMKRRRNTI